MTRIGYWLTLGRRLDISNYQQSQVKGRTEMNKAIWSTLIASALMSLGISGSAQSQQANMTFFITSVGSGKGGDLGGLAGADAHCQSLAQAVGAGNKTWRAY